MPNGPCATAPRRGGRPRGFDRERALAAAERLFRLHGYEGTSIAQLTDAMGVAPPSLYAAFGSKAELYRESVRRYEERDQPLPIEGTGFNRVRAALLPGVMVVAADPTTPECMISSGMLVAGPENAGLATEMRDRRRVFRERVEAWIVEDVDAGRLPPGVDAPGLARFYATVMQGLSMQALDGATADELRPVAEAAQRAWPTLSPAPD